MKAIVFPGQGSQYPGMAKDICEAFPECMDMAKQADDIVGFKISEIMFNGQESELKQTKYTQPAIFLHSMLISKFLQKNDVAMTAGHSLGEYSALCFSESLSFEDAMKIVAIRGKLMQEAGEKNPGSMAAIIGISEDGLNELLRECNEVGPIQAANFNSPGQVVISGDVDAIKKSLGLAKSKGAKLAKELVVSGAFHSSLMKSAQNELESELSKITINDAAIPVCMNTVAKPVKKADEIRKNLVNQLTSPVLWEQSIKHMAQGGIKEFMEVGPQKVLQGLIKRIESSASLSGIDTAEQLAAIVNPA